MNNMFQINLDSKLLNIRKNHLHYYSHSYLEELLCLSESIFEIVVYQSEFSIGFEKGTRKFQNGVFLKDIENTDFSLAAQNSFSYDLTLPINSEILRNSDYFQYVVSMEVLLKLLAHHYDFVSGREMRERICIAFNGTNKFLRSYIAEAKRLIHYDPSDNDGPHTLFWSPGVLPIGLGFHETKKEIESYLVNQ